MEGGHRSGDEHCPVGIYRIPVLKSDRNPDSTGFIKT